jgi:hypothetical protein
VALDGAGRRLGEVTVPNDEAGYAEVGESFSGTLEIGKLRNASCGEYHTEQQLYAEQNSVYRTLLRNSFLLICLFDDPAATFRRPVALRPRLATGLPFAQQRRPLTNYLNKVEVATLSLSEIKNA